MTLASEMFTVMQWAAMPLRFLVSHLVVAMTAKKRAVLEPSTNVKVIEAS
jgi:hypothetical protein